MSLKSEYKRLRKNLLEQRRYYLKKGLRIDDTVIPENVKNPTQADINRLKNVNVKGNAYFFNEDTGEVAYLDGRNVPQAQQDILQQQKEDETYYASQSVIDSFLNTVYMSYPKVAYPVIKGWLDSLKSSQDIEDIADMLYKASENGVKLTHEIAYDESLVMDFIAETMEYLGLPQGSIERILDDAEQWNDVE